jgi:hypothetical protein
MANALEAIDTLGEQVAALHAAAHSGRSRTLKPSQVQPTARSMATLYFESVRSELDVVKSRQGLVDEIDFVIQSILQLAAEQREKEAYLGQLKELRPYLLEATIDLMKSRGSSQLVISPTERAILDTLTLIIPHSATSYEQALRDIASGARVSWRGTATELRETLREVIDHFAPDSAVTATSGFVPESGQSKPTQRQKVRHFLRARRSSSAAVAVAEASLNTVDEAVAALARSTYQRGSVSTHVGSATSKEIKSLKRYVDALLAELLEIS